MTLTGTTLQTVAWAMIGPIDRDVSYLLDAQLWEKLFSGKDHHQSKGVSSLRLKLSQS